METIGREQERLGSCRPFGTGENSKRGVADVELRRLVGEAIRNQFFRALEVLGALLGRAAVAADPQHLAGWGCVLGAREERGLVNRARGLITRHLNIDRLEIDTGRRPRIGQVDAPGRAEGHPYLGRGVKRSDRWRR